MNIVRINKDVKEKAFFNNQSIEVLNLAKGCTKVGRFGFYLCENIKKVVFSESLISLGESAFEYATFKDLVLPNSLKKIGTTCFANNYNLEQVTFPLFLEEIGLASFENCDNLKEIKLPSGLRIIKALAFSGCSSLEEVVLPKSLIYLGESAFTECKKLKRVKMPRSIEFIGEEVFDEGVEIIYY